MDDALMKPLPSLLRHLILEEIQEPVVFHGFVSNWELLSWDLRAWAAKMEARVMPFRSGKKKATKTPQWERTCQLENMTMEEFVDWNEKQASGNSEKWLYFDYKHMNEWFKDKPNILKAVNWECLGFHERGGAESTLWIGSDGAHTPCHMDTYGCNLVAQVYGKKQWLLFPPTSSATMLPTRVPYEESSIYSKHNFYFPEASLANSLEGTRLVTLNPGDVLLVPHHWWHYVENIETAISINTWIPLPSDDESRLQEALVQLFVSQVCGTATDCELLLNPNEDDLTNCPLAHSLMLVETCMKKHHMAQKPKDEPNSEPQSSITTSPTVKKAKLNSPEKSLKDLTKYSDIFTVVPECSSTQLQRLLAANRNRFEHFAVPSSLHTEGIMGQLINAFCHPDVISRVKDIFYQEYQSKLMVHSAQSE